METKQGSAISPKAMLSRIRRHYAKKACVVRKSRAQDELRLGRWLVVNASNYIASAFDDIEAQARELTVMQPWETVVELIGTCDRVHQAPEGSGDAQCETMSAGRYWVGDLCYVLRDAWHEAWQLDDGAHTLSDGRRIAKFRTVHGDGIYDDDQGNEYPVDSGSLGCILADDIRDASADTECGAFVTVTAPFAPRRTYPAVASPGCDGGVLHLAGVQIQLDAPAEGDD